MNMNSAISELQGRVALLIDGENISCTFAPDIQRLARKVGKPLVRKVYGNASACGGWESQTGFQFVHTGSGKNSADMKLAIDAMGWACTDACDTFVIVTCDSDFSHLAYALIERGLVVVGIGEYHAAAAFRHACTRFHSLSPEKTTHPAKSHVDDLIVKVTQTIERFGVENRIKITELNGIMHHKHGISISNYQESNWQGYFSKRSDLFECDPSGPEASVRLK